MHFIQYVLNAYCLLLQTKLHKLLLLYHVLVIYPCLKGKSGTVKGLCNKSLSFFKKSIETLKIEPFSEEKSKSTHACFKEKRYTDFTRFVGTGKSEFPGKR